jgi:hypothetical protein
MPSLEEKPLRVAGGRTLRPLLIRPEKGILLPAVWLQSEDAFDGRVVLFLSENGKESLVEDSEIVSSLLEEGVRILAVDLRGTGETAPGKEGYFWDFLAGRPISGQRVKDVLSVLTWLASQGTPLEKTQIWAQGLTSLWVAMACLQLEPPGGLVLEDVLISFEDVILTPLPRYNHEILLPGITTHMDIPDICGALCPLSVKLINPLRADKTPASQTEADRTFERTHITYRNLRVKRDFSVTAGAQGATRSQLVINALLGSKRN